MPSVLTHAVVGFGLSEIVMGLLLRPLLSGLSMALAAAPDLDVFGLPAGYSLRFLLWPPGIFPFLFWALLAGLAVAGLTWQAFGLPWWQLGGYFFLVIASHGLLDGFTNGGLGIAFFSPFDTGRYFFPWQPIQVSPIGLAFFGKWGVRVLASELLWVWLPLAGLVGAVWLARLLDSRSAFPVWKKPMSGPSERHTPFPRNHSAWLYQVGLQCGSCRTLILLCLRWSDEPLSCCPLALTNRLPLLRYKNHGA